MKIFDLIKPLFKGNVVENSITGKRVQLTIVPSMIILSLLVQIFKLPLTPDTINGLSAGIDALAVLLNSYLTTSTTDKIGL